MVFIRCALGTLLIAPTHTCVSPRIPCALCTPNTHIHTNTYMYYYKLIHARTCNTCAHIRAYTHTHTRTHTHTTCKHTQGNPPLDIPTRESREKAWCEGKLLFHVFGDDLDKLLRNDATIFYVSEYCCMGYVPLVEVGRGGAALL